MSKKSRRRNKRLLAMLALAGGAAMMGRGKGTAQGVSGSDKAKFTSDAAYSPAPKAVTDVIKPTAPVEKKYIVNRSRNKIEYSDGSVDTPGTVYQKRKLSAGNKIPPSMRSGALHAEGYTPPNPFRPSGNINQFNTGTFGAKKGGRVAAKKGGSVKKAKVTGIAKRGFGRALMKGKK